MIEVYAKYAVMQAWNYSQLAVVELRLILRRIDIAIYLART
jgi:hypothetical protein